MQEVVLGCRVQADEELMGQGQLDPTGEQYDEGGEDQER